MDRTQFWLQLEYRICREIERVRGVSLVMLWCDGVVPQQLEMVDGRPVITGYAWVGFGGKRQEKWTFALTAAPSTTKSLDDADWQTMFPAEHVTDWLTLDFGEQRMSLDLSKIGYSRVSV